MARKVLSGLIQASNPINDESKPVAEIQAAMLEKHLPMIHDAGKKGVQILCLQEIFNGPYFCPGQDKRWYDAAEPVPGPTVEKLAPLRQYAMQMVVPLYEREKAASLQHRRDPRRGWVVPQVPKTPSRRPGFWGAFFKPGNLGYPVWKTRYATIGAYICYDRHFPEGARALGLAGAEIVYNPSATVAGLSQYLWKLEQPAHAVANGYFVGAINRVGTEAPWNIGKFYGSSYFVDPRGQILACASEDQDELLVATLDLDMIEEVRRTWQFFRDRRPDAYGPLVED